MATDKQKELFERLCRDREFPPTVDTDELRKQFSNVSDKSASEWIERALALPEKDLVPPPF